MILFERTVCWQYEVVILLFLLLFKKYYGILVLYGGGAMQYKWSLAGNNSNRDFIGFFY